MNAFDWIVFDSTGTLMTPSPQPAKVYHEVARTFGCRLSIDQVRSNLKEAMNRHFFRPDAVVATSEDVEWQRWQQIVADALAAGTDAGIGVADLPEVFEQLWHHFAEPDAWAVFEDVPSTLDRLRSRRYRLAVASNFDRRLRKILKGHAFGGRTLDDRFDEVFISSEIGRSKPQREFFDAVFKRLDTKERSRVLMIGDTPVADVEAAEAAGWSARHLVRDRPYALKQLTSDL